jgi:hypothetical protein
MACCDSEKALRKRTPEAQIDSSPASLRSMRQNDKFAGFIKLSKRNKKSPFCRQKRDLRMLINV